MEGVGSRFGRTSSRYTSAPAPAVFSGPVRKWKKQWVTTPPPPPPSSTSRRNANSNTNGTSLLLCRWIPLPSDGAAADSAPPQLSPKRKFRYAPIVDLEEKKREVLKKVEDEANSRKMDKSASSGMLGSGTDLNKHNINDIFNEDFQEPIKAEMHTNKGNLESTSFMRSQG